MVSNISFLTNKCIIDRNITTGQNTQFGVFVSNYTKYEILSSKATIKKVTMYEQFMDYF